MKKILIYIVALLGAAMFSCAAPDNGTFDTNSAPGVTIYSYPAPLGTDPDVQTNIRIFPNNKAVTVYVLVELKSDKETFVTNNGEKAYIDRVVANGVVYNNDTNVNDPIEIFTQLSNVYTITAVPVDKNGKQGEPKEIIFNGVHWQQMGTAVTSLAGGTDWGSAVGFALAGRTVNVYWSESDHHYMKVNGTPWPAGWYEVAGETGANYPIKFIYNDAGKITQIPNAINAFTATNANYWGVDSGIGEYGWNGDDDVFYPYYHVINIGSVNTTVTLTDGVPTQFMFYEVLGVDAGIYVGWGGIRYTITPI